MWIDGGGNPGMVTQTMSSAVVCALPFSRVAVCHVLVAEERGSNVSKRNFKHASTIPPPSVVILAQRLWSPFASTPLAVSVQRRAIDLPVPTLLLNPLSPAYGAYPGSVKHRRSASVQIAGGKHT